MSTKEISIDELVPGMYISRAYTSDSSINNAFQNFKARSRDDVIRLKLAGINKLLIKIDTSESTTTENTVPKSHRHKTSFRNEIINARQLIGEAKKTLETFSHSIMQKNSIDITPVVNSIEKTFSSVKRNEQAMIALLHINRHSSLLVTHSISVMAMAGAIYEKMGLSDISFNDFGTAAILHDIGWIRMPVYLISKSRALSNSETALLEQLSEYTQGILKRIDGINENIAKIILNTICNADHTASKIINICDRYDRLTHGMMGMEPRTPNSALKGLYIDAELDDTDKEILSHLIKLLGVYPITSAVQLDTGEKGIVLEQSREFPLQPKIRVCYNAQKKPLYQPFTLDLSNQNKEPESRIESIIDPSQSETDPLGLLRCTETSFDNI
ncbi:MAG: HD-GYP domain-containing protein [Gammaproteobacteria bacterium]|nr:MAG: HD-GYP domain-containing protein [Gammaproteobacteria bacterium]